ncbi:hypothetical protein ACLOJK_031213 [Asimina triloba]
MPMLYCWRLARAGRWTEVCSLLTARARAGRLDGGLLAADVGGRRRDGGLLAADAGGAGSWRGRERASVAGGETEPRRSALAADGGGAGSWRERPETEASLGAGERRLRRDRWRRVRWELARGDSDECCHGRSTMEELARAAARHGSAMEESWLAAGERRLRRELAWAIGDGGAGESGCETRISDGGEAES